MSQLRYNTVRNLPVARFYYKGNHSHPIRRTILVTESNGKLIKGYELRCGTDIRNPGSSPIRTFLRSNIATFGELRKGSSDREKNKKSDTTLTRSGLLDLVVSGA